jgi:Zn-finger nucleic acid-binding protein
MRCPKCPGTMHTYERNGVHIEQCDGCRGIFLDFGELDALTRIEARLQAPPPAPAPPPAAYGTPPPPAYPQPHYGAPAWGHHGSRHYHHGGLSRLFFSS